MSTNRKHDSLASTLFGKSRRAVLSLFYGRPDESFYLRQALRETHLAQGAVQRELKRFSDAGILVRSVRGREVYYQANPKCPIFEELCGLIAKTAGLADVLRETLTPLARHVQVAFIYGSQASGKATAGSDIDLFVVGDMDETRLHKAIRTAEEALGRPVNYSLMDRSEFARRRQDRSGFVGRVLKGDRILILGGLDEV